MKAGKILAITAIVIMTIVFIISILMMLWSYGPH